MLIYLNVIVTGCGKKEEGRICVHLRSSAFAKKENLITAKVSVIGLTKFEVVETEAGM